MKPFSRYSLIGTSLSVLIFHLQPQVAVAAGFASQTQSGSGLGNAYAGGAAVAEDASVVWYNPAAMTELQGSHIAGAIYLLNNNRDWNNRASTPAAGVTLGQTANMSKTTVMPNFFYTRQINSNWHTGFALNTPFGLKTEYNQDWMGRYQGVGSDIETINLNFALAYKVSPVLSIGGGLNWQRLEAKLTSMQNYAAVAASVNPALIPTLNFRESLTKVEGSDDAFGYNLGLRYKPTDTLSFGIHYRSAVKFNVSGDVIFNRATSTNGALEAALAANFVNGAVKSDIKVPAAAHFSVHNKLNPKWDIMADLMWTQWSTVQKLEFLRSSGSVLSSTRYNWTNTMRYSVGTSYQWSDSWKLRLGVAYDESPVPQQYRTARLPDNDRFWISGGIQYAASERMKIDFGYTYVKVKNSDLNGRREDNDPTGNLSGTLTGTFKQHVHILGAQISYRFP